MDGSPFSAFKLSRSARTLPASLLLWITVIVFCVCSAQEAFCSGKRFIPPGIPLPPADSPLPWEEGLLADIQGRRNLADRGITFFAWNEFHVPANVSGGIDTAIRPLNRTFAAANFDFEKLGWWEGGQFRTSFTTYYSKDNINDFVGSNYNPSTIYQENDVKLFQLYYGQWFFKKQAHVKIGRIGANNEDFVYNNLGMYFDSVGYNDAPGNMYSNNRAFTTTGVAQWGARLRVEPHDRDYSMRFGVYNTSETLAELTDPDEHGMNFGFDPGESLMVLSEFLYELNKDQGDTGMPGRYRVGALYDTGDLDRLDVSGRTKGGNFGFYLIFDQMIYRESPESHEGLWAFTQFSMNPDEEINPYPYHGSWGLVYQGLFPGREKDVTAFGNYYSFNSKHISGNTEVQFNLVHMFTIKPWLQIGPEIQYIIRPGGTGDIDNALVLNLQTMVTF